jgi:glycosyltransferase involved in cell wall biosynthesis
LKRIDLLLAAVARLGAATPFKLVVLAGDSFARYASDVERLVLTSRVIVRERVTEIEDYLQAADIGLITSETESFCLSILEAMNFACPSVAFAVGGIPEVVKSGEHGLLVPFGDTNALSRLINDPVQRASLGQAARGRARSLFSAATIVPRYEALYRRVLGAQT